MDKGLWRSRLQQAIDKSGKSLRSISLEAKVSPGYLHSILKEGKEPTLGRLIRIADTIGASLSNIAYGVKMTGDEEQLLRTYAQLNRDQREAFLRLAKSTVAGPSET